MSEVRGAAEKAQRLLEAVDAFYAVESAEPPVRRPAVVLATRDGAWGTTRDGGAGRAVLANARLLVPNAVEWVRARARARAPVTTTAFAWRVAFEGEVVLNPHHGTVVVLGDSFVDKFHFEEPEYFRRAYQVAAPAVPSMRVTPGDGVLRVRMPRFAPLEPGLGDAELLERVASPLEALHACAPTAPGERAPFAPTSKVKQIFRFHRGVEPPELTAYLDLAEQLLASAASLPVTLSHGDLWRGNVLRDARGRTVLIDLDKMLLAPPAYDAVHLLLLHRSMQEGSDVRRLLQRLEEHVEAAVSFLKRHPGAPDASDPDEARWSVLLYALLKGAEWDARHGPARSCLAALQRALRG